MHWLKIAYWLEARINNFTKAVKMKSLVKAGKSVFVWCRDLVKTIFPILLVTYLLLILLEALFEGSVSSYLNLNYLLIAVIVFGIGALLAAPGKAERVKGEPLTAKSIIIIICAGLGGAIIIWYKTREMGWLSYVISVVGGGLIVILSLLIWRNDDGEEGSERENSQDS
jgi:hypothetical protein